MAPVYFALRESQVFDTVFLATAQHRQMLDQTLGVFGIKPEYDLDLMQPGQTLPDLTGRVLTAVSAWCNLHQPSALLVQGDTTTVLASAMAAFYAKIPVGHVEAGLRTGNMLSPFPEEMNRRLTSPITRWHFCPTEVSKANLEREGITAGLYVTGNTVVDALLWVRNRLKSIGVSAADVSKRVNIPNSFRSEFLEGGRRWILVTGHRRESFGDGFERICQSIAKITESFPDVGVLYPVHLNPQVREPVQRILGSNPSVALVEPAGYEDFLCVGAVSTRSLTTSTMLQYPSFSEVQIADLRKSQSLPKNLGGWQFESYHTIERTRESSIGHHSNVWQYRGPEGPVIVSTDFPFRGFHLLDICYEGSGWHLTVPSRQLEMNIQQDPSKDQIPFYPHILEMKSDDGRFAIVTYSLFRLDGTPIKSQAKAIRGMERFEQTIIEPISFQIQVFYSSDEPISDSEKQLTLENLTKVVTALGTSFKQLDK